MIKGLTEGDRPMKPMRSSRVAVVIALGSLAALAAGCHDGVPGGRPAEPGSTPNPGGEQVATGTYDYVAFGASDTTSRVVGTLTFQGEISNFPAHIEGTWNLQAVGDPGNVGPQIGAGTLKGDVDDAGYLTMNLDPGMVDNNVFLVGSFVGGPRGSIEGTWRVSTFVGETASGRFRAVPRAGR
jgi:hypothetical protein